MIARVSPKGSKQGCIAQEISGLPSLTPAAKIKRKQTEALLTDLIRQQVGKHVQIKFCKKIPMIGGAQGYGGKFAEEKTARWDVLPVRENDPDRNGRSEVS
jgi:hypothetical protein